MDFPLLSADFQFFAHILPAALVQVNCIFSGNLFHIGLQLPLVENINDYQT